MMKTESVLTIEKIHLYVEGVLVGGVTELSLTAICNIPYISGYYSTMSLKTGVPDKVRQPILVHSIYTDDKGKLVIRAIEQIEEQIEDLHSAAKVVL